MTWVSRSRVERSSSLSLSLSSNERIGPACMPLHSILRIRYVRILCKQRTKVLKMLASSRERDTARRASLSIGWTHARGSHEGSSSIERERERERERESRLNGGCVFFHKFHAASLDIHIRLFFLGGWIVRGPYPSLSTIAIFLSLSLCARRLREI